MSMLLSALPTYGLRATLAVLALIGGSVHAATYTVGTTGGCSHVNLQTAVNSAQANPGADTIRVNSETFNAQEVSINTDQELNIIGGYADCSATEPTANARSILDGSGGNARPVMRIVVPTGGLVRLRNLRIRDGDNGTAGEGGGIYFEGNGLLGIVDSTLSNNIAGYGAGLYARGTGADASVEFGANVTVVGNTARYSGGGVYVDQVKFYMLQAGNGIFLNEAQGTGSSGYGGGLVVLSKERNAYAFIGGGMGSLGVIYNNTAKYGGGVAIVGDDGDGTTETDADVQVHSALAATPARIRNNKASIQGGGIYARGFSAGTLNEDAVNARAFLWNAELMGNSAPDGAALYIDGQDNYLFGHAEIHFNADVPSLPTPPADFVCPSNQFCGGILDNVAQSPDGTPSDGAVVHMVRGALLTLSGHGEGRVPRGGLTIEGNRGGRLIHAGTYQSIWLENVLVSDNDVSHPLIHVEGNSWLNLADVTLAGNVIASGNPVLQLDDGELTLRRSIVWQPGRTVLQCSGCDKTFERVMANERDSLDGGNGTQVVVADPRFIDPANGDYRLRAASPAVDYAAAITGDDRDTLALRRDIDLPVIPVSVGGVRDIGAFERQTLMPLLLNGDMNTDVRLWTPLNGATVTRDATMNASGGAGSGALHVVKANATRGVPTRYARQCIHLPGPGRYSLNGYARTQPNGLFVAPLDSAELRWELSHDGGETCTSGTYAAMGLLAVSSSGWSRPANPAVIDVLPADWTSQSSLMVALVVTDNSVAPNAATAEAWFDGITLDVESLDDTIFANGFDG